VSDLIHFLRGMQEGMKEEFYEVLSDGLKEEER
jgi:hypothetical protein